VRLFSLRSSLSLNALLLNRSWDGLTLYAVSSDGTMGVFNFEKEELDGISPHSAQEQYLHKFGFVPPPLPEGYSHYALPNAVAAETVAANSLTRTTPPPSPKAQVNAQTSQTGFGHPATINGDGEHVNKLVAKRGNKKRIVPTTMNDVPSASTATFEKTFSSSSSTAAFGSRLSPVPESSKLRLSSVSSTVNDRSLRAYLPDFSSAAMNQMTDGYSVPIDSMNHVLETEVPIDSLDTSAVGKGKRKASAADLDDPRPSKPRTLGGDKLREIGVPKVIGIARSCVTDTQRTWSATPAQLIPTPLVLTYLSTKVEGTIEDVFEGRNSENFGQSRERHVVPSG
jgi:protein HIRA/HIR1